MFVFRCFPPLDQRNLWAIKSFFIHILRKTIEGYLNSFDNIIIDKIIFKQSIFVLIELPL